MTTTQKPPQLYPVAVNGFYGLGMVRDDGTQQVMFFRECIPVDTWNTWSYGEETPLIMAYIEGSSKVVRTTPVKHFAGQFNRLIQLARQIKPNHEQHVIINIGVFQQLIENYDASLMAFEQVRTTDLFIGDDTYITLNGYRYTVSNTIHAKAIIPNAGVQWNFDDTIERISVELK